MVRSFACINFNTWWSFTQTTLYILNFQNIQLTLKNMSYCPQEYLNLKKSCLKCHLLPTDYR